MRDPQRIAQMVEILGKVWKKYPEWRLVQLVLNAHAVSNAEDELLERGLLLLLGNKPDDPDGPLRAA